MLFVFSNFSKSYPNILNFLVNKIRLGVSETYKEPEMTLLPLQLLVNSYSKMRPYSY